MPCYYPLKAVKSFRPVNGRKHSISFDLGSPGKRINLPCGQCIGCRLDRSRQWAVRCYHEASLYNQNCFITLTYDNDHLPADGSIHVRDWQLFMKRLRKKTGRKIRFFHCGEYGDQLGRPHYHACLFGYDFPDKLLFKNEKNPVYLSSSLSDIWGQGFCTVGAVTFESAAYVARYILKKINGEQAAAHYERVDKTTGEIYSLKPEYTTMSRRPGIGAAWYHQFKNDLYPDDFVVVNGKKLKIPKFYDGMYEITNTDEFDIIKLKREEVAKQRKHDNTPDRLEVKRKICESRIKQLKREI